MSARVMFVDDSRTIRAQVRRTLEHTEENYSLVEKGDGMEALQWLSGCPVSYTHLTLPTNREV